MQVIVLKYILEMLQEKESWGDLIDEPEEIELTGMAIKQVEDELVKANK